MVRVRSVAFEQVCQSGFALLSCGWACIFLAGLTRATEPLAFEPPLTEISAQNRLLLQQADQLYRSDAAEESAAVLRDLLARLVHPDTGPVNEVVQVGGIQKAGTLRVRRFLAVPRWVSHRLGRVVSILGGDQSELDAASQEALKQQIDAPQLAEQSTNSIRFSSTASAWQHHLLEADLCLERGWTLQALAALQRIDSRMQFSLEAVLAAETLDREASVVTGRFAWTLVPLSTSLQDVSAQVDSQLAALVEALESRSAGLTASVLRRLAIASQLTPSLIEPKRVFELVKRLQANRKGDPLRQELDELISFLQEAGAQDRDVQDPAKTNSKHWDTSWPSWNVRLPRYTSTRDQTPASRPRVGEVESGSLPYRPVVWGGVVYLNELNRVTAFDFESGRRWPRDLPLADSGLEPLQLIDRSRGVVGVPRGDVQVIDDCLYARIGSVITGWAPKVDASQHSTIVGIDLAETRSRGSVVSLPGFPLHIPLAEFPSGQFEGPPLASGDLLFVPIAQRSNVGLRRSVAAFDRWSGELIWRSAPLASGTVAGTEQTHHVAHQCLTLAGGYLYGVTNLGAVVCLNPIDGHIEWLSQYSRPDRQRKASESPSRYFYRSCTPCVVHGGLVYCAPSDCGELFALDATSGDLVWSTVATDVPDAIFILGVEGDHLLVSGDRLVWIDRKTGQVQARFPGSTTPGISNSLPSPRGLGRGTIHNGYVYYPVAGEILVFDAQIAVGASRSGIPVPQVCDRIKMDSRGAVGGNLLVHDGKLIFAGPSRLMVFGE